MVPDYVRPIIDKLPESVLKVGVFVDESIKDAKQKLEKSGLTAVQFHGSETVDYVREFDDYFKIKAIRLKDETSIDQIAQYEPYVGLILLDAFQKGMPGGTGITIASDLLQKASKLISKDKLMIAGGLTSLNVGQVVESLSPAWVDTASGVEKSPGRKDKDKVASFVREVA